MMASECQYLLMNEFDYVNSVVLPEKQLSVLFNSIIQTSIKQKLNAAFC